MAKRQKHKNEKHPPYTHSHVLQKVLLNYCSKSFFDMDSTVQMVVSNTKTINIYIYKQSYCDVNNSRRLLIQYLPRNEHKITFSDERRIDM